MRITLEKRKELSRPMLWLTPALAVALTFGRRGVRHARVPDPRVGVPVPPPRAVVHRRDVPAPRRTH